MALPRSVFDWMLRAPRLALAGALAARSPEIAVDMARQARK